MAKSFRDLSVSIKLGPRSYDAQIGSGVIDRMPLYYGKGIAKADKRAFLISDERLLDARARTLAALRKTGWDVHEIPVRAGESLKEWQSVYPLYGALLSAKANRQSTLFALGGGTIGDAAGFVASTYLRGIPWVGIPTTLLAQVDSSIGGKTGINHDHGKNLVGSFYQPSLVVCETEFLKTLSQREVISGLGEIVKYGLVFDPKFFAFVQKNWKKVLGFESEVLSQMIHASLKWKAKAVAKDEFDRTGIREVLNFGHTFGHALEKATRYEGLQHGEAVIWGMRFALALSVVRKKLSKRAFEEADAFLKSLPVPSLPSGVGLETYLQHMSKDKKSRGGSVHFVLLKNLGQTISDGKVTEVHLAEAFQRIR